MANKKHLKILKRGVEAWNAWRREDFDLVPGLRGAPLSGADLRGADLRGAHLIEAKLDEADLRGADLILANLTHANLHGTDLRWAHLRRATLRCAHICLANLSRADLSGADLGYADLSGATLVGTQLQKATLDSCWIYGISAWDIALDANTKQHDLIITPHDQPAITVDNLEVAQFVYLLLHNEKIRHVIDTITSKVVLILGRFTDKRKAVLDAIRAELRNRDFTPILFDFDKPASKDLTGTVETLARMARFIIADLTDPSSIPHELATIVPLLRTTPILPLRLTGSKGYSLFDDFQAYKWVLKVHKYKDQASLISTLPKVIEPADKMAEKLRRVRP